MHHCCCCRCCCAIDQSDWGGGSWCSAAVIPQTHTDRGQAGTASSLTDFRRAKDMRVLLGPPHTTQQVCRPPAAAPKSAHSITTTTTAAALSHCVAAASCRCCPPLDCNPPNPQPCHKTRNLPEGSSSQPATPMPLYVRMASTQPPAGQLPTAQQPPKSVCRAAQKGCDTRRMGASFLSLFRPHSKSCGVWYAQGCFTTTTTLHSSGSNFAVRGTAK